jgi:hypothetical protein
VPLFIDRLPFYAAESSRATAAVPKLVPLPIIPSRSDLDAPPPGVRPQCWWFDSAFNGEALAWRHHLEEAGMNPEDEPSGTSRVRPSVGFGPPKEFPQCAGDLWLISNLQAFAERPYRIVLRNGIAYRNVRRLPDPDRNCPLIGMRALENSGLILAIDFRSKTVSVWTPGPWYECVWSSLRRLLSGFATRAMPWSRSQRRHG